MRTFYDKLSIVVTAILLVVVVVLTLNSSFKDSKPKETAQEYSVSFYDEDKETVLGTIKVKKGEKAEVESPTKESTPYFSYTFSNWAFENGDDATESLAKVTKDLSVYATYVEADRYYTVTFIQPDGKHINSPSVKAGEACNLNFTFDPPYDGKNDYVFECWIDAEGNDMSEALSCVLSDMQVTAKYKVSPKTFSLTFTAPYLRVKHGDGTFVTSEQAWQVKMREGAIITIQYDVPEGYTDVLIVVNGATVIDESAGTYRVFSDVEILAALVK